MSRRTLLFCAFAVGAAVLFIRLGLWQVGRLRERQARNVVVARQQRAAPIPFATLPRDTGAAHYRPVAIEGRFDYDAELVATNRSRRGSPGADLITPVRVAGSDTAVLVNRGWVYSPDGATVDRGRWREGDSAMVTGYVELYSLDAGATSSPDPHIVRRISRREIASKISYPVAPYYVVLTGGAVTTGHPARREIPVLDDGPHRSYAVQWFSFAAIALAGAAAVVRRERRQPSPE